MGELLVDNDEIYLNVNFDDTIHQTFQSEFLFLLRSVSECFFYDKGIFCIKDDDNPFNGSITINLEKEGDEDEYYDSSRLFFHINKYEENHITIEFYKSKIYPFIYANIYNNSSKKYFDFINSKRQFLLTFCSEFIEKYGFHQTYCIKNKLPSNNNDNEKHIDMLFSDEDCDISEILENAYQLKLTEWPNQRIVSHAQYGAADKFQEMLCKLPNHENLIQELRLTFEGVLFNLTS